jgi:Uma2 family endonuclease
MTTLLKRYQFDTDQYAALVARGIIDAGARVELLDGEIVEMSPIGPKHLWTVNNLDDLLHAALGSTGVVSIQNPVLLSPHDEPEPDVAVLRPSLDLRRRVPLASDVLLLIEVSDSSLSKDIQVKLPIYARARIAEVWIADVEHDEMTRHSLPVNVAYTQSMVYRRGATITSIALPGLRLAVDDILPF